MRKVYIVTYHNFEDMDCFIEVFDNKEAAESCRSYLSSKYDNADIGSYPVYTDFISDWGDNDDEHNN